MKKGMATVWVVIITVVVMLGVGGAGYYLLDNDTEDGAVAESDENVLVADDSVEPSEVLDAEVGMSDWKTLSLMLASGEIKHPKLWGLNESESSVNGQSNYYANNDDGQSTYYAISQFDMKEWLKGPNPDDGYVLQNADRKKAYQTMLNIFNEQKLSPETRMELNDYGVEFFTYSTADRSSVNYIESYDGKSRGFTMMNGYGQDIGLASSYVVSVYNKENNIVTSVTGYVSEDFSELKSLNKAYGDYSQEGDELVRIDRDVHQDFMQLMQSDRDDLSFGDFLNELDAVAKSVTY